MMQRGQSHPSTLIDFILGSCIKCPYKNRIITRHGITKVTMVPFLTMPLLQCPKSSVHYVQPLLLAQSSDVVFV